MGKDFQLGDWLVQPQRDCIQQGEETVHLKPKAMAVLVRLAEGGGGVVTRDELFESVWPGAVVSDATLTQCVVELRRAFGDTARDPKIIETVPKVGFRLIPPLFPCDEGRPRASGPGATRSGFIPAPAGRVSVRRWPLWSTGVALALALAVLGWWALSRMAGGLDPPEPVADPAVEPKALAVLPFADLSEDRSQGWFAEGLAEDLRNTLVRLRGLRVAGGMSSSHFAGREKDLQAIGSTLDVGYLLHGSVRREDQRVRVSAQLVDAATGFLLWSETFDRPLADIFDIQAEISESVAVALSITLGVGELGNAPGGTRNFEAFELTLRAQQLFWEFSEESVIGAIARARRAVEIDPLFAVGWARLATYSYLAPIAFHKAPPIDFLAQSQEALDRARSLNPELPALLPVEMDLHAFRREWAGVERAMSRATRAGVALLPEAYFSYGVFLMHVGRAREAQTWLGHARRLEPLESSHGSKLGHAFLLNGRAGEALAEHERVWGLGAGNRRFQAADGLIAALAADDPEIIAVWLGRAAGHANGNLAGFFGAMGERLEQPAAALRWLEDAFYSRDHPDYWIAVFAAYLGDADLAIEALLRSPDPHAIWAPLMADVRSRPGFRDVAVKLGLPDYWREFTWADFCRPVKAGDFACE